MESVSHIRIVTGESEPEAAGANSIRGKDIPEGTRARATPSEPKRMNLLYYGDN